MTPVMTGDFGTVTEGSLRGMEDLVARGRVGTIPTTELLRTVKITRRVQETLRDFLSLKL